MADDIFCNNFLHFGYKKTESNKIKLIEKPKLNTFLLTFVTF